MIFDTISNISQNSKNSQIISHNETSLDQMFQEKKNNLENDNFLFIYYCYKLKEKSLDEYFSFESLTDKNETEKNNDIVKNYDSIKDLYQNNLVESILSTSSSDENNLNENISIIIKSKKSNSQRSISLSPDKKNNKDNKIKSKSVTKKKKTSFFLNIIEKEDSNNKNSMKKNELNFNKKFKKKLSKDELCSICQNNFCNKELICEIKLCNHIFHQNCLDKWIKYKKNTGEIRCPLCKTFI